MTNRPFDPARPRPQGPTGPRGQSFAPADGGAGRSGGQAQHQGYARNQPNHPGPGGLPSNRPTHPGAARPAPAHPNPVAPPQGRGGVQSGTLSVTAHQSKLAKLYPKSGPNICVDGVVRADSWGTHDVLLTPGSHRIQVSSRKRHREVGEATLTVDVGPGETTKVYYSAPIFDGSAALGTEPQKTPGLLPALIFLVSPFVLLIYLVIIFVV